MCLFIFKNKFICIDSIDSLWAKESNHRNDSVTILSFLPWPWNHQAHRLLCSCEFLTMYNHLVKFQTIIIPAKAFLHKHVSHSQRYKSMGVEWATEPGGGGGQRQRISESGVNLRASDLAAGTTCWGQRLLKSQSSTPSPHEGAEGTGSGQKLGRKGFTQRQGWVWGPTQCSIIFISNLSPSTAKRICSGLHNHPHSPKS